MERFRMWTITVIVLDFTVGKIVRVIASTLMVATVMRLETWMWSILMALRNHSACVGIARCVQGISKFRRPILS